MSKKYSIKDLADIALIPDDRLDAFFADLKQWIVVQRALQDGFDNDLLDINGMDWSDDGEVGVNSIELNGEVVWSVK